MSETDDIKSTWYSGCPEFPQLGHHITMRQPRPGPCNNQCPWLVENHDRTVTLYYDHEVPGIEMPTEFTYAKWKRARLWESDLRDGVPGYGSLCHVRLPGTQRRSGDAWDLVGRQCTGALVMQQREVLRHVACGVSALTPRGAARVASDMLGRDVEERELRDLDMGELLTHANPALLNPKIGCDAVAPPLSEREIREWGELRGVNGSAAAGGS